MDELAKLKESLAQERPVPCEILPDIELYMDQVLSFMPRQQVAYRPEAQLTSPMVNNYIKEGLLARAKGKKYSREHLARLTAICALKQVLQVKDLAVLFASEGSDAASFYTKFTQILDFSLEPVVTSLPDNMDEVADAVLQLATAGYVCKLASERLIDIIRLQAKNAEKGKK